MAFQCWPTGRGSPVATGMGMSLAEAERRLRMEETRLAETRRIAESEKSLEAAQEETAELQRKVVKWLPIVAGGVALLIGGIVFMRRRKKGG